MVTQQIRYWCYSIELLYFNKSGYWRRRADIKWNDVPSLRSLWWLKKEWGPVNVFSTGWWQKWHLAAKSSFPSLLFRPSCPVLLSEKDIVDGVEVLKRMWAVLISPEMMHRSRTNGESRLKRQRANPGSPLDLCVCVCVSISVYLYWPGVELT